MIEEALLAVVTFLRANSDDVDGASVQINDEGRFILRLGVSFQQVLSIDEFVKLVEETCTEIVTK